MRHQRRHEYVDAYQHDGTASSAQALAHRLSEHAPAADFDLTHLDANSWLVLSEGGRWRVMPDAAFQRAYVPAPISDLRSCLACVHFLTGVGDGLCEVFNERIHDEQEAASDCTAFQPI